MSKILAGCLWLVVGSLEQCSEGRKKVPSSARDTIEIFIARTACYGRCPIDEVELTADGTVRYYGKRFVPRLGRYTRQLSEKELEEIRHLLIQSQFESYQEEYDNPYVTDLPSLILQYRIGSTSKRILCRMGCPPELPQKIEKLRSLLAEQGNFQMVEGSPSENGKSDAE
ncbi:MAG: DUF6438 domain-containing protein [Bacteroidia bacterium]|nr:DUF6438 domain-containing protein [Bacteroidia bacterium]MDW8015179.1 DUF6438 domain-containing protein [Bacteroidia bacterium]